MPECIHGQTGFCYEEATPQQRATLDTLHRHAYAWAVEHLDDDLDPERYAADFAGEHYALPEDEWPSHPAYSPDWAAKQRREAQARHQIVEATNNVGGGWRWITFGDGTQTSVTVREIAARLSNGTWTITERAAAQLRKIDRELRVH